MKLYIFTCILTLIFILGCIAPVKWVKRKGGTPEEETWVPVCPYCNHVVDYGSLQCSNPKCRALLTWNTKTVYANKLYLEKDNNNDSIKEENKTNIKVQKREEHSKKEKSIEKIKEQKKETKSSKDKSKNSKNVIKDKNNNKISNSNKTSQEQKNKDENKNKKKDDEWNFEEDEW